MAKQRKKINLLDVYRTGKEDQADKLMRRRGGGGAVDGKNFDKIENLEFKTDEIDAEDDEEITEDDAFDEEDDEKYGLFFAKKETEESDKELSGDEDDYVDLSEMLEPVSDEKTKPEAVSFLIPDVQESESDSDQMEYLSDEGSDSEQENLDEILDDVKLTEKRKATNAPTKSELITKTTSGPRKKIAFGDLIEPVADDTSFGNVKKQLNLLESSNVKAVSVPLAPRMQEKLDRKAAKEETEKSVSQWVPIVKKNREADTLSFPMNLPPAVNLSSGALIGKFEPFTEMEKEIYEVLEKSGLSEKKQKEFEEMELNKLSKAEMEERRAELAKMRSLLFYQEQKQKRIAKIKSKTYRKIAKKASKKNALSVQELHALDPERAKEEQERLDFERAKERMTLKHKNSGKWAKKMLGRHEDAGSETHKALMQQLEKGEQLRKKINGIDSDESHDSDNDEPAILQTMTELNELNDEIEKDDLQPTNGLFGMKFMQKGLQRQKIEAQNAVLEFKRELGGVAGDVVAEKLETRRVFSQSTSKRVDEPMSVNVDNQEEMVVKASGPIVVQPLFQVESFDDVKVELDTNNEHLVKEKLEPKKVQEISNPAGSWIDDSKAAVVKKSIVSTHKQFERNSKSQKSLARLENYKKKQLEAENSNDSEEELLSKTVIESENNPTDLVHSSDINSLSHQEIMSMTFANDDIAKDFEKEKAELADMETGLEVEPEIPGWGEWSGPGIKKRKRPVKKVSKFVGVEVEKRKDFNLKHVIINEKRQKKAAKYLQPRLPHGFDNREQYESTLSIPLGSDWNPASTHKKLVQPRITAKLGAVIEPLRMVK